MTTKAQKAKDRFARQFHSPEFVEWSNLQPCIVCFRYPTECAHNPTRRNGTWRDVSPLCKTHHREQHGLNSGVETFQRKYDIDFEQTNAQHVRAWEAYDG